MSGEAIEYRDIPGFPGYRVGSDGSVWSRRRKVYLGGGRGCRSEVGGPWRQIKTFPGDECGHLCVTLHPGNKRRYVHQLVLEAFVGPRPPGAEACHFPDRDPANNRLDNLRWASHSSNMLDAVQHGTLKDRRGEKHQLAILTADDVRSIRKEYAAGLVTQRQLAERYGVRQATISVVVCRKTWKHVA